MHYLKDKYGAPLFPGYVFVEMQLDGYTYKPVLDTPFVVQYLCPASGVRSLSGNEAENVREYKCTPVGPGTPIDVVDGPLKGLSGRIKSIKLPRVKVGLDVFGEELIFDLSIKHVSLAGIRDSPDL